MKPRQIIKRRVRLSHALPITPADVEWARREIVRIETDPFPKPRSPVPAMEEA